MVKQTEVQRIAGELARSNAAGDALMAKFRSASRADVKLACALRGFFDLGEEAYLPYLRSRLRPAVTELVLAGKTRELEVLDGLELLAPALMEEMLNMAIRVRVPESIVWLLQWKESRTGFRLGELTL